VLLIVNRTSGTGCSPATAGRLTRALGAADLELALVDDHPSAREAARAFIASSRRRAAIVVGGGGGTLRAAGEGVCDAANGSLPAADKLVVAALRMGSGNVLARRLGISADPIEGARQVAAGLAADATSPCAVMRCRFGRGGGGEDVRHAVTMCGLGQFGRTSGDLARWHARLPRERQAVASVVGIEVLNNLEYAASAAGRLIASTVHARTAEEVEVSLGARTERFRLLAGAVMNLPIAAIPFDPGVRMGEAAAGVLLWPRGGRLRRWRLSAGEALRVELVERDSVEFFLDEDPERAHRELVIDIRGTLSFVRATHEEAA
jgi:hypothetical protein